MASLEKTKTYDLVAGIPLIGFYAWTAWTNVTPLPAKLQDLADSGGSPVLAASILSQFLTVAFAGLLVVLLLARTVPEAKADGIPPRLVAVLGTFASMGFLLLPATYLPAPLLAFSVLAILGGLAGTLYALYALGRSFSILPEARELRTDGPYGLVRHPVYAFEELTIFGMMLQHAQPWSLLLFLVQFSLQLMRIHFEEQVLSAHFPEYGRYAARTARLIPGVY